MTFGEQVRRDRKQRGYTQKVLADMANVSLMTIRRIEAISEDEELRNITFGIISTLAKIFDDYDLIDQALMAYGLPTSNDTDYLLSHDPSDKNFWNMLYAYDSLNLLGQTEASKRVQELKEIRRYRQESDEQGD